MTKSIQSFFLSLLLIGVTAQGSVVIDPLGNVATRKIELTSLTKADFNCDSAYKVCRYTFQSIKKDELLRGAYFMDGLQPIWKDQREAALFSKNFLDRSSRSCVVEGELRPSGDKSGPTAKEFYLDLKACCSATPDTACFYYDENVFEAALRTVRNLTVFFDYAKEDAT